MDASRDDALPASIKKLKPKRVYCRAGESYSQALSRYRYRMAVYRDARHMHHCATAENPRFIQAWGGLTALEVARALSL
jgi:hypothetical protein